MKKLIISLLVLLLSSILIAQEVPQGMRYQAVARDVKGQILSNETITLKIELVSIQAGRSVIHYSETHNAVTNQVGLFSLVIGEGTITQGAFNKVPWSTEEIRMQVSIREKGSADFGVISDSKLLAVPYAFHAATASQLSGKNDDVYRPDGVPSAVWHLKGNRGTDPETDALGTTDHQDLVIITNNIERLRVTKDGDVNLANSLNIGNNLNVGNNATIGNNILVNNDATIGNDLEVKNNVNLNTEGGNTNVNGPTTVDNTLNVSGATTLGSTLDVLGATHLHTTVNIGGTLEVDGATKLNNTLKVDNGSATWLTGTLTVDMGALLKSTLIVLDDATFAADVAVAGNVSSSSLNVTNNIDGYLATFQNNNNGNGDGIKIKLGKTHPKWDGGAFANIPNVFAEAFQQPINTIRGWVIDGNPLQLTDLFSLFPGSIIAGTAISLTNMVTTRINNALDLPWTIGPFTIVPEIDLEIATIGPYGLPQITAMPAIPQIPNPFPVLSAPNFEFTDVNNSLTKENEYIRFVDKDERMLGAIRAQSINDWSGDYLDGAYFMNLLSACVGIDLLQGVVGTANGLTQLVKSYNKIGVEYSSGHGDYAEWLERVDVNESITAGDIVAVKSGKITKDLQGAEQIMVVSYRPIMLGNAPVEGKEHLGNKVAFMGQIPVKVMGPVNTGDYIVASTTMTGYGVAVHPDKMTIEQTKLSVGRSWETNINDGPKMVNVIVGVQNGDFLQILKRDKQTISDLETRVKALETKMNMIITGFEKEQKRLKSSQ